jgi:choline dehydrogenase-like flavoprotein
LSSAPWPKFVQAESYHLLLTSPPTDGESEMRTAVCIVGAGAAGITIACELDGCGFDVLLVEAGGFRQDAALCAEMYRGSASGLHLPPTRFRRIGFGGTTAVWGGRCVPYEPIDFEYREHVPQSGWPIEFVEVARHYPRALRQYCDAGTCDFSVNALAGTQPGLMRLRGRDSMLVERIERYSPPTHFGKAQRKTIERSRNVSATLGLRCLGLHRRENGRVDYAVAIGADDRKQRIFASTFVLAAGALETTRLLFVSDPAGPGLGNESGMLGRYYQCHFANVCAELVTRGQPMSFGFEKTTDAVYARRKLVFTPAAQRKHRLLNTTFRLHFPDYADASHGSSILSSIYLLKSLLIPEYEHLVHHGLQSRLRSPTSAHLRNVVADTPSLLRFGRDWLFRGVLATRKLPYTLVARTDGTYPIEFNSEQIPQASSRVSLNGDMDRHGLPGIHVDWRLSEEDVNAAMRAFRALRETVTLAGQCALRFNDAQLHESIRGSVPIAGHHIGTARMARGATAGVVDTNGAVHGVPNLYVSGAAVFPTSSHANPTLTIVAMAIRLADHLRARAALP